MPIRRRGRLVSTKAEKAHMGRVAELGCAICRMLNYGPTPAEVISTFASQSVRMYSISPAVSFEEMQAK